MLAVGIKILKNRLSEYVRRAAAGEVVLITDRDKVVAELSAPRLGRAEHLDDVELAALLKRGLILPPRTAAGTPLLRFDQRLSLGEILSELDGDRGEG